MKRRKEGGCDGGCVCVACVQASVLCAQCGAGFRRRPGVKCGWCQRPARSGTVRAMRKSGPDVVCEFLRKSRPSNYAPPQHDTRKREDPTCTTGHTLTLQPISSALQEDAPPATSSAAPPFSLTWPCHPESWPACSPPPCASCAPPRAFLSAPPPARKAREKEERLGVQRSANLFWWA